ncbi:MAG TPA: YciI family protein [Devosia sp.]|nr:YciI family protein [Devosia sp.]
MKFMCLVYFEPGAFDGATEAELTKLTDDTIVEDNELRASGHLLLGQPLQGPETAVTIHGGRRAAAQTDGPFVESKEWLGGFTLIEARDMAEAIALTKQSAIMKYASIEIRPTLEQTHSETGQARPALEV